MNELGHLDHFFLFHFIPYSYFFIKEDSWYNWNHAFMDLCPLHKGSNYVACWHKFENEQSDCTICIDTNKSWIDSIHEECYGDIHDQWLSIAEQEQHILTGFLVEQPVFSRVCVAQSLDFCASFCLQFSFCSAGH